MSYEPLHHKYRPKSFAELVGQEAIATTLTNAIRTAKIAPAYLFTGPRGTGKTSSARILAKSLNCLKSDKPTAEPCGVCDVCQGITKGYSLDVIEIDAASNTGVDNIRELIEKAQFAPVQCRYKVYVVDECHMLSSAAFNALLKTLEEPPKHVVFVLATTDPQRVLPTIISRCQRFDFRRIQLEAMVKHLSAIASKENINISLEAVTLVAQLSQGGLRDAESLLDQLALLPDGVTPDKVWDLVGSVSEQDLLLLLGAIAQDNPELVLDCTRKILDRGREPLTILQNLAAFYRDLLIAKTAANRHDLVACTQQTWEALVESAQSLPMNTILLGQKHLQEAELQIKNTTQPRLWLEVTLLGLLPSANIQPTSVAFAPSDYRPSSTQPHSQKATQKNPSPHPTLPLPSSSNHQETANTSTTPPSSPPVPPSLPSSNHQETANGSTPPPSPPPTEEVIDTPQFDFAQIWQQVLSNIQQMPRRALLGQMCHLIDFDGAVARIGVKGMWYDKVKSDVPMITAAFQQTFSREIQVTLEKGNASNPSTVRKVVPANNNSSSNGHNGSSTVKQPPSPTYNQKPAAPPPQQATPNLAPKTAPITPNTGGATTPPPTPNKAPLAEWETDEVAIAAQRLAQFFDGQIVRFTDDGEGFSEMATSEWAEESDLDDE
ncbi:DNA polymerase III subunit gamma/tau [Anabaena subtropica]|uniref:DNA polymerase III subunit gamma/tau n=1 Tax=Anabaena subtropica FACHB-260 TaxID=2692884 RepID=A0ABR8CR34_9NOST|nr:DNA polymerase III subunit gamma/tau [Anabaena subtropica]MBD2345394.1 DNA polymerase III subunit gamma/tau [Anabaena subtropica FACHB-260]